MSITTDKGTNLMLLSWSGMYVVYDRIPPGPFRPEPMLGEYVGTVGRSTSPGGAWRAEFSDGVSLLYPSRRDALDALAYYHDKRMEIA